MRKFTFILLFIGLFGCEEEDIASSCLSPPCGNIDDNHSNISILAIEDSISSVVLNVNSQSETLSTDGMSRDDFQYFSCWQTTSVVIDSGGSIRLTYLLNGEKVEAELEGAAVSTNAVVVEINGEQVVVKDYIECNDTDDRYFFSGFPLY